MYARLTLFLVAFVAVVNAVAPTFWPARTALLPERLSCPGAKFSSNAVGVCEELYECGKTITVKKGKIVWTGVIVNKAPDHIVQLSPKWLRGFGPAGAHAWVGHE